eukprot:g5427.t1
MDRARKTHATGDYRASARAFKDVAARAAASGDELLAARATANIGAAMQGLEDYAGAVQMFGQAVTTMERLGNRQLETAIRINLAVALEKAGQAEEAEAELRRCVAGATDKRAARMLAGSLIRQRRYHEALEVLPNDAVLLNDVGAKLDQSGRTEEALAAFERAVAIDPTLLSAQYNAGLMLVQLQRECEHAVGLMVQSMFELHDRKSFFVVGYSLQPAQASSSRRKRIEAGLDIHRDLSPIVNDPMKMAMIIARDQIDILVDLNGHSAGNRFELFALRPAKIAVTHAATFSVPAGAPEIFDYTIVDPVVVDHNEYNSDRKAIKGAYLVLPETFL